MKDSFHRRKHLKKKAIKEANKIKDSGALPEDMVENPNFRKEFEAKEEFPKEHTCHKKTSKRTSPDEVKEHTAPDHPHKEGERWIHNLQQQTNQKAKKLDKKLAKKYKKAS